MMQPDTSKWLLPDDGHPSLELLRLYQREEELTGSHRHQVEKHLLDCELCSDILAGMTTSNRAQTQAAIIHINQKIKNRVQSSGQQKKVRPMYVPMLRAAAAIVILVISASLFRYLQQPNQSPVSEKSTVAQSKPESAVTMPVPVENPVIKPAEPEPQIEIAPKVTAKTQTVAQTKTKVNKPITAIAPATEKPEELAFPIDSAVVLDAFAIKTEDTPRSGFVTTITPDTGNKISLQESLNKVASSLTGKQLGVTMKRASTFTGQTVAGKVTDASGEPIAGASVVVKGSTTSTTTDATGNFSLNVPPGKETLTFNYTGYQSQEQKIDAGSPLAVQLKEDQHSLQEITVIAYSENKNSVVGITRAKPQSDRKAFNQYIQENLRYPAEARQQKQQGRVEVGFTVTEQGELTNFKILKSLSPSCDAEAIRVIKEGPAWQPTIMQGQRHPENVQVSVPFKL